MMQPFSPRLRHREISFDIDRAVLTSIVATERVWSSRGSKRAPADLLAWPHLEVRFG